MQNAFALLRHIAQCVAVPAVARFAFALLRHIAQLRYIGNIALLQNAFRREPTEKRKEDAMFPIPNYKWKCKNCGEELIVHQDEEFPHLGVVSPKCPNCNGEMVGNLIVRRGPFPENPFRND